MCYSTTLHHLLPLPLYSSVLSMPTHWTCILPRTVMLVQTTSHFDGFCSLRYAYLEQDLFTICRNISQPYVLTASVGFKPSSATHSAFDKAILNGLSCLLHIVSHQLRSERCVASCQNHCISIQIVSRESTLSARVAND